MTPEEAVRLARDAGHIVIVHRGEVFFNSTDVEEVRRWEQQGARIVPHFDLDEIARRKKKNIATKAGWEIHLLGAVGKEWIVNDDGDQVDVTGLALLNAARS